MIGSADFARDRVSRGRAMAQDSAALDLRVLFL